MKNNIITISREFGSGGHSIAQALAEQLGIPCYDKALVEQVAKDSGFDPAYIEKQGEYAASPFPFFKAINGNAPGVMNGLSAEDYLWCVQRQTILDLADKGPCVIVGRCADFILRDRPDALHVFICADKPYRVARIVARYGPTAQNPEQRLHQKDKQRRVYYRYYTDREWGAPQNYGLCLNTGIMEKAICVQLLTQLVK